MLNKAPKSWLTALLLVFLPFGSVLAESRLISHNTDTPPLIDGSISDAIWSTVTPISVADSLDQRLIEIHSVYTDQFIYFVVQFPDSHESRKHKTLIWDGAKKRYETGPAREDVFVFKWSMESEPIDLSLSSDSSYQADIWYWKAFRTDLMGFADDKIQRYQPSKIPKSRVLYAKSGRRFYLQRTGDKGRPAYKVDLHREQTQPSVNKYSHQQPRKSRADVKAKGVWHDGYWTIEFKRRLHTPYNDDIRFDLGREYQFGVSLYEIAGRKPDPNIEKPNFGSGDVGESILLAFD